jgi:hypothetical protein
MTAAAEEMDEVVVVAYGRAKASYTGSATTIKGEFRKQSNYKRSFWN